MNTRFGLSSLSAWRHGLAARERGLLGVLVMACALGVALQAFEWMESRKTMMHAIITPAEVQALGGAPSDPAAQQALRNSARKAQAWSIPAETRALAVFEAQSLLRSFARDAGLDEARVTEAESARSNDGAGPVRVRVAGVYDATRFERFLRALAQSDVSFSVQEARVDEAGEPATFELILSASFADPEEPT